MTSGVLLQVLFDLILLAGIAFLWVKLNRPQKDDPRLSRGLQLLQSKIAVLEDLSDQVESQVTQITALMEAKGKDIQNQILQGDKQIQKIEAAMGKSLEVAKIFQDRIPHQEIIERQNTLKYVKAARLAHQGLAVDEIAEQVDLSRGEIELITKVNRDQLQFSVEDLPEWAKEELAAEEGANATATAQKLNIGAALSELSSNLGFIEPATPKTKTASLESQPLARAHDKVDLSALGEKFRQALPLQNSAAPAAASAPTIEMPNKPASLTKPAAPVKETAQTTTGKSVEIQKVVFPRLDMTQHLS